MVEKLAESWGARPRVFGVIVDDLDKLGRDDLDRVYAESFRAYRAMREYAECARNLLWASVCIADGAELAAKHYREAADENYDRLPPGMRFRQNDPRRMRSDDELKGELDEKDDE